MDKDKDQILADEAVLALSELLAHMTIMGITIRTHPNFVEGREGWRNWVRETRDWAKRRTEEAHDFAEAYDG